MRVSVSSGSCKIVVLDSVVLTMAFMRLPLKMELSYRVGYGFFVQRPLGKYERKTAGASNCES